MSPKQKKVYYSSIKLKVEELKRKDKKRKRREKEQEDFTRERA
jgi:hypothetical protein